MRLALFAKPLERVTGLDLILLESDATVQDLADAFQPYAGCEGGLHKRKLGGAGACRACVSSCCTTSIIAPDPVSFDATAASLQLSPADLIAQRFDHAFLEQGVLRLKSYPCTFLSDDGLCTIYQVRSLICRFFICCPYSPSLERLVHNILGAGLAALAARLRSSRLLPEVSSVDLGALGRTADYEAEFHRFYQTWVARNSTSLNTAELPPAWSANPFDHARNYSELPLYHFATADHWRELTRGSHPHPLLSGTVRAVRSW